jgi:hypothetical protein
MRKILAALVFIAFAVACTNQNNEITHGSWLKGDKEHFVEAIERQFDGFSRSMVEVHYRYDELYWAGQDQNWEYADYQLEHIVEAIEKGFERRPARKENSLDFLGAPTDLLQQAIDAKNLDQFNQAFIMYNAACQSCHIKEEVAFIKTIVPDKRLGHTRFQAVK